MKKLLPVILALMLGVLYSLPSAQVWSNGTSVPSGGTGLFADGSCGAAPGMAFTSQPALGWYRVTTDQIALCTATTPATLVYTGGIILRALGILGWVNTTNPATGSVDTSISRGGVGLIRLGGSSTGMEYNAATATIGACGTGTVTTGSRASAGEATSTGSTTCTVNFGANFTNIPFCTVSDETTLGQARVSAIGVGSFTVTDTSNDKFNWTCTGFY